MNWNWLFNRGLVQGLICLILIIALVAGLCLPGLNMQTVRPEDPLDAQQILDISVLEVSENISSLNPVVVPTGGSAQPTEPEEQEPESDTPNTEQSDEGEENEEADGSENGDGEGNQEGLQGEEGGELVPELAVVLSWKENRNEERSLACQPSGTVSADILNNRLSGGALSYEVSLYGKDMGEAMIEQVSFQSDFGSGELSKRGTLFMQGGTYRITVSVAVGGQRVPFHFELNHVTDVTLKMEYALRENGGTVTRETTCENTKSRTVEAIYSDQLADGLLEYAFSIVGEQGGAEITSVSCYQSGSGNSVTLSENGEIRLLLRSGTTGENTFTVRAQDESGNTYRFTINVPFKPRGAEILQIETYDLTDGQTVTTGTTMNFRVSAYRPEDSGNVYIPANGTDTRFTVTFNGLPIHPDSSNGRVHDFIVVPPDPVVGDTNEHVLNIYAEDSYGNWGEKTLVLRGQRAQEGQVIGTAYLYVDMTVLGLGVHGPVAYDVLSNEPVSYVILKAIMGRNMGEIYGSARDTFGWGGIHDGSPEPNRGFYLRSLYTGLSASALADSAWPRREDGSIDLEAIDAYFGANIDMATLWRCMARNGLAKSGPDSDGGFGQYDYTSASGWLYMVNGIFPTEGMDKYSLKDGDTLTLLYSLAGGWEVGGAGDPKHNQVGYCIQAVGGSIVTNHIWVDNECVCCGRIQSCLHENTEYVNLSNGQHVQHCTDCDEDVGSPAYHSWTCTDGDLQNHQCSICSASDAHFWQEKQTIQEPGCVEAGEILYECAECFMEKTEYPVTGHHYGNAWEHDSGGHFKLCKNCGERGETMPFRFYWDEGEWDYICQCGSNCEVLHDFTLHQWQGFEWEIDTAQSSCRMEVLYCYDCNNYLYKPGVYEERHNYVDGYCTTCSEAAPDYCDHDWVENTVDATCTEDGYYERYCTRENCGVYESDVIYAYGHSFAEGYCQSCGEPDPDYTENNEEEEA